MTFTYTRKMKSYYSAQHDEYFYDEYDFEYEPERRDLVHALADILVGRENFHKGEKDAYKLATKLTERIIDDCDIVDELAEKYKDELRDWFEDEALESERGD